MSLRGNPVEEAVTLPSGRHVLVRIGVPDDPYIAKKELDTVDVELFEGERPLAAVNTILDAGDTSEARRLAREIVDGFASGEFAPTAAAIEPLADRRPS